METLGKFTVEAEAWVETHQGDFSEVISLDYDMAEDDGAFFWILKGYGHGGQLLSDETYESPEEAYGDAVSYTNNWAFIREQELKDEYNAARRR